MINELAPILIFTYKRPIHLKKMLSSLKENELSDNSKLFIFSDAAKNELEIPLVNEVREIIRTIDGFKDVKIIERDKNLGLANSIIAGVTEIINKFGKAIILEDDLVTSSHFLQYMNEALNLYESEEKVISIHGYIYPVKKELPETFFLRGADCWGWATWKRGWDLFEPDGKKLLNILNAKNLSDDFDLGGAVKNIRMLKKQIAGKNDSWAIRWHASAFIKNKITLYPGKSLVRNIGADGEGTHVKSTKAYDSKISTEKVKLHPIEVKENDDAKKSVTEYFRSIKPGIKSGIISLINTFKS